MACVDGPCLARTRGIAGINDGVAAATCKVGGVAALLAKGGAADTVAGVGNRINAGSVEDHGRRGGVTAGAALKAGLEGRCTCVPATTDGIVIAVRINRRCRGWDRRRDS